MSSQDQSLITVISMVALSAVLALGHDGLLPDWVTAPACLSVVGFSALFRSEGDRCQARKPRTNQCRPSDE